jgi:hypothetical protein
VDVGDRSRPASCWPRWTRWTWTSARRAGRRGGARRQRHGRRQAQRGTPRRAGTGGRQRARYVELGAQNFISAGAVEAKLAGAGVGRRRLSPRPRQPGGRAAGQQRLAAERAGLRQQRANVRLLAPADGVVISRDAEPGSTVVAGQAVLRLIEPGTLWVKVRLDQAPLGWAWRWVCRRDRAAFEPGRACPARWPASRPPATASPKSAWPWWRFDTAAPGPVGGRTGRGDAGAAATPGRAAAQRRPATPGDQVGVWRSTRQACASRRCALGQTSLDGQVQVLEGLQAGDAVVVYSEKASAPQPHQVVDRSPAATAMISLAGRDILHSWGKFVLTGIGLGLLIGVTLTMAGVYRGMVDDARAARTTAAPTSGWCSRTRRARTRNRPACATTWCAACAGCPAWRVLPTSPT